MQSAPEVSFGIAAFGAVAVADRFGPLPVDRFAQVESNDRGTD